MRLIITLTIAGFLSGVVLVSTYLFTKPLIERNKAESLKAAVFEVLPGTSRFDAMTWDGSAMVQANAETAIEEIVYFGFDSLDHFTGVAIPGEASGYQDIIAALAGYSPKDRIVIGLKVLESKETPGLGDKILFNEDFHQNFLKLSVDPEITVVKKGEKTEASQIEAITGATISSKAIGKLLEESMSKWKDRLKDVELMNEDQ